MNKARTQFIIATIALIFLGAVTMVAVVGEVVFGKQSDLTLLFAGALTTATGQAMSYFFRVNNHQINQ